MEPANRIELLLTPTGIVRRSIHDETLPESDAAITRALLRSPRIIPYVGLNPLGGVVHLRASDSEFVIASQIPHLNLKTHFAPIKPSEEGDVILAPRWAGEANTVVISPVWSPPPWMKLWFITIDPREAGTDPTCHLVATSVRKPGIFRLPLPNTYNDGKICPGADQAGAMRMIRDRSNYVRTALHFESLAMFMNTQWNADLSPTHEQSDILFRFNLEGQQIEFTGEESEEGDINAVIAPVSHSAINWLYAASTGGVR